ncbi:hypothetical protein VNO78_11916 [Psophocarpus tetragonolobus]|uniref:Uncharacterized protein n=1 Tax=Psophocarpus tetragonolobus TaxID=3891 RepID=A0AAN9SP16_PSOTE
MNEMYVPSPKQPQPTNIYDDLWEELCNDNDDFQLGEDIFKNFFQSDESISLDNISWDMFNQVKELEHTITEGRTLAELNLNSSKEGNISISPARVVESKASTSTSGKGSLKRLAHELEGNMFIMNPIPSSENYPNFDLSFSRNYPNSCPTEPNALNPQLDCSFGNGMVPDALGNSLNQFQSSIGQVHPYGTTSSIVGASASASVGASVALGVGDNVSACGMNNATVTLGTRNLVNQFQSPAFLVHPHGSGSSIVESSATANVGANVVVNVGANASASGITGMNSTTGDPQLGGSFCNSMFPNAAENPVNQFQSSTFQLHPLGSASFVAGSSASITTGVDANVSANASAGGITGMNNTTITLGTTNPQLSSSFGNSMFLNTLEDSLSKFQSSNFPMYRNDSVIAIGEASTSVGTSYGFNAGVGALTSASAFASDAGCNIGVSGLACDSANANIDDNVAGGVSTSANTTISLAAQGPPQVETSFCNSMFPNIKGKSLSPFQSCPSSILSLPVHPIDDDIASVGATSDVSSHRVDGIYHASASIHGSGSNSHQKFPRYLPYQITGINQQGVSATMPQCNKRLLWSRPPSLEEFNNFVDAWEVN